MESLPGTETGWFALLSVVIAICCFCLVANNYLLSNFCFMVDTTYILFHQNFLSSVITLSVHFFVDTQQSDDEDDNEIAARKKLEGESSIESKTSEEDSDSDLETSEDESSSGSEAEQEAPAKKV